MSKQRVLLLGATGATGGSILDGSLEHADSSSSLITEQVVEALVCPASAGKPQVQELAKRGVELRVLDIGGPVDVLIRAIDATSQLAQLNLAIAAKKKKCTDTFEDSFFPPALPSGRGDYVTIRSTMPTMLTDLRDVGRFVALIVKDPRSMNKGVACYGDFLSENEQ
ncbi:hypothetical protein B0H15DRAFT_805769 [Mycena belliarum]|uniref:Uncharacterized protein n=1 Tax=Mycena belliarum TaxID=1033014 RepID=A0AAD6XK64_9AGAR|nr:hypothetical protein B0H15DRAFT_805769 [Mycena belliae]